MKTFRVCPWNGWYDGNRKLLPHACKSMRWAVSAEVDEGGSEGWWVAGRVCLADNGIFLIRGFGGQDVCAKRGDPPLRLDDPPYPLAVNHRT